jgi:hypothetical protein
MSSTLLLVPLLALLVLLLLPLLLLPLTGCHGGELKGVESSGVERPAVLIKLQRQKKQQQQHTVTGHQFPENSIENTYGLSFMQIDSSADRSKALAAHV